MGLLGTGFFFASLLLASGEMGYLTEAPNLLLSFCLGLLFLALERPAGFPRLPVRRWTAVLVLGVLACLLARLPGSWRVLAFTALAGAALAGKGREDSRRAEVALLLPTTAFFLVFLLAHRYLPHFWWVTDRASLGFSRGVGAIIGQDYAMSATASGLRVGVLAASWGLARWLSAGRRDLRDLGLFLVFVVAANAAVLMLLTPIAMAVQAWAPGLDFLLFNSQVLYLAALLGPIAWYSRRVALADLPGGAVAPTLRALPLPLAAGFVLAVGLTLMPRTGPGGGRVVILDEGYLNWQVPVFGRYGERSAGMFGRLPGFLEAQGYEVVRAPSPVTPELLAGSRVLVLINVMEFFDPAAKAAIWDFVAAGGSLLVLGDHTGVKGIRGPFNDLLDPVNIEFKFDSATFRGQGWRDALELLPSPIHRDVIVAEDIQIWVGASLDYAPPGRPVIVGKYGFSDLGDAGNLERSYLGDRVHNPGEQMDDICLVAEAPYGKGRVLVFGDTSPFQNGALVSAWAFVERTFQVLTAPRPAEPVLWRTLAVLAGLALVLLSRGAFRRTPWAWAALGLGLTLGVAVTGRLAAPPPLPRLSLPKVLIDHSHVGRFDQLTWYDDCIGGLESNVMRNGFAAMTMRKFSPELLRDSRMLVVIAPARPYSREEVAAIRTFVENGGFLILSVGFEEMDRSEALLALFDARIENVPLAHFDVEIYGQPVHVAEGWPLEISNERAVPIARYPGYDRPFMAFVPRGRGGALLIADSQFLLDHNLEALEEWKVGNILFFKELMERLSRGAFTS